MILSIVVDITDEKLFTTLSMNSKKLTPTTEKLDADWTILFDIPVRDAMKVETSLVGRMRESKEPSSKAMPWGPKISAASSMISSSVLDPPVVSRSNKT